MRLLPALVLLAALPALAQTPRPNPDAPTTAYVGGQWWDGERFAPRDTVWAERGVFVADRPARAERTVDLAGRYVVPPFGDAHTHLLDSRYTAQFADSLFLDRGVFYALVLNNSSAGGAALRPRWTGPGTLDVAYAQGGITSTGSHPAPLYERIARNAASDANAARADTAAWSGTGDTYWFWDTLDHVEAEWDAYLATQPDAVKAYLTYSAACDVRPSPRGCGLRPEVLAEVVRRAHAAGLPVYAHVNTEDDVRRALAAGVDALAHLPSGNDGVGASDERFWLGAETVRHLAASGATAVATASLAFKNVGGADALGRRDTLQAQVERQRAELRALVAAGVPVALGADQWMRSSVREANYLVRQGVLDPADVLRAWSETTPRAVFPGRAVGRLAPGYEASLLALACDPIDDWSCTERIGHREKQGARLGGAEVSGGAGRLGGRTPRPNPAAPPAAYVGGRWWDGERFVPRDTVYAEGGVFTDARPARVERTVDLAGRFVVPPYGDAHTHMLSDPYQGPGQAERFERDGVFYALVLTDRHSWAAGVADRFDGPGSIDVAYAHGGWTSPRTHPVQVYEWQALRLVGKELTEERQRAIHESRLAADDAYFEVASLADLDARWDTFLAHGPDVAKVYLLDAAREFGPGTSGMTGLPSGQGLAPDVLRAVVERAHAAGLRVFAHVETGADVALAVESGVDGFAHLPGYGYDAGEDAPYVIDQATVAAMADRDVVMVPTARVSERPGDRPAREALARDLQRRQLRRLHAAGVRIGLGADRWSETSKSEADFMVRHGFFDRATVLDLWTRVTPQVVFPGRAVGLLAAGYEASLLALACDPTADWSCADQIAHREKQGAPLGGAGMDETAAAWRALDVATFTAPPAPTDGPLVRGLKALADADLDAADAALREALATAPDSLHPFVRRRLAETAAERFDWAEVVRQRTAAGDDVSGDVLAGFARFPAARVRFDGPEATVPFDGLRAAVRVNGEPVQAVVDTGAPGTGIPRGLAERLGLRVDTTARGRSAVPSMGLVFDTYAVLVDSVTVGGATFYDVPATVGGPETPAEGDVFLGANLFRRFAGGLRYGYADSTFTVLRDAPATAAPPQFLIDGGSAPVVPVTVGGAAAHAIVDTGNQASVYLAEGAFDVPEDAYARTASGTLANGYEWSHRLYTLPFEIPGHPALTREAYEGRYVYTADDPVTVILGKTVWAGGALTLDFANRRVRFDPAAGSVDATLGHAR